MDPAREPIDRRVFLKIKIRSLAEEARIIRRTRCPRALRSQLQQHRVAVVRPSARAALLAYAFLRGRARYQVEGLSTRTVPDWHEVQRLIRTYGVRQLDTMSGRDYQAATDEQNKRFARWRDGVVDLETAPAAESPAA